MVIDRQTCQNSLDPETLSDFLQPVDISGDDDDDDFDVDAHIDRQVDQLVEDDGDGEDGSHDASGLEIPCLTPGNSLTSTQCF